MVKVRTTTKAKGNENVDRLRELLRKYKDAYVTVGVHSDAGKYTGGNNPPDVAQVALWNEFGTETIPERSFFRSTLQENEGKINAWREELIEQMILGKMTMQKALETIGFRLQVLIQNKIKSNVPPPLAPSTVDKKRRDGVAPATLIDTGLLLRSVTYKVVLK